MNPPSRCGPSATRSTPLRLLAVLFIGFLVSGCVGMPAGRNIPSGSLTVAAGEILDEDVNLYSGDLRVEEGGAIEGDVRVFSGDAVIDGTIGGDLMVFSGEVRLDGSVGGDLGALAGRVELGPDARVGGDLTTMSGETAIDPSAEVAGAVTQGMPSPGAMMRFPRPRPLARLASLLVGAIVMAGIAAIIYSMAPANVARTAATAAGQTWVAGGIGFATIALSVPVFVILAITICGIPLVLLGALALGLASLFGSTALGRIVADWLEPRIDRELSPVAATALGAATLSATLGLIGVIPCLGWLVQLAVSSIGLGATLLTVFGQRDYPAGPYGSPPNAYAAPPTDGEPPDAGWPLPDREPPLPDSPPSDAPPTDPPEPGPPPTDPPLPGSVAHT